MGQLLFKKCFFSAIRSGRKRTTIRRWKSARVKANGRAYCPGLGWLMVESVQSTRLEDLTRADAQADGFASLRAMRKALSELYPNSIDDGRQWYLVKFRLESS